jgi:hypothetical protein
LRHECSENKLPQLGVVVSLVKEDGLLAKHPFLAGWESWLEKVSFGKKDEFGSFGAGDHDARASQDVGLEDGAVLGDFGGKKDIWVLRVHLEGLSDVRIPE